MPRLITTPGVAGADEAGRGPLAGPVVAAAVLLPEGFDLTGLNDSKKLDAQAREEAALRIRAETRWTVALAEPEEVDRRNILRASLAALGRALRELGAAEAIVDGNQPPEGAGCPVRCEVKGDGRFAAVAAASILAKTERDRIMTELALAYPEYGFDRHFGYPTPEHRAALARYGPCPAHRRSFRPVAELALPGLEP